MQGIDRGMCRDGQKVNYSAELREQLLESHGKPTIQFGAGGLSYSPELGGIQYQKFEATQVTKLGFVPSLKLVQLNADPPREISATPEGAPGVPYVVIVLGQPPD